VILRIYGDFGDFGRFGVEKNKAKQACPEQRRMEPILFSPQIYLGVENPI